MQDWERVAPDEIGDEPSAEEQRRRAGEVISGATSGIEAGPKAQRMGTAGAGSEVGGEEVWE